jgi:DNA polymerase-3 subunit beta
MSKESLTIDVSVLKDVLSDTVGVTNKRSVVPALGCLLFKQVDEGNAFRCTACNLEQFISVEFNVNNVSGLISPFLINATVLNKITKNIKSGIVDLSFDNKNKTITLTHEKACFRLSTTSYTDFPDESDLLQERRKVGDINVNFSELFKGIKQTSRSFAVDDARKVLHGTYFNLENNSIVSTDGKRLSVSHVEMDISDKNFLNFIAPPQVTSLITSQNKNINDNCVIELYKDYNDEVSIVVFEFAKKRITTKLIKGAYPNYKQVIPESFSNKVTIDRKQFLSSLHTVDSIADDFESFIALNFCNNKIKISKTTSANSCNTEMDIEYDKDSVDFNFNAKYLSDAFSIIDKDVITFSFNDGISPCSIEDNDGFFYIIMPMRT